MTFEQDAVSDRVVKDPATTNDAISAELQQQQIEPRAAGRPGGGGGGPRPGPPPPRPEPRPPRPEPRPPRPEPRPPRPEPRPPRPEPRPPRPEPRPPKPEPHPPKPEPRPPKPEPRPPKPEPHPPKPEPHPPKPEPRPPKPEPRPPKPEPRPPHPEPRPPHPEPRPPHPDPGHHRPHPPRPEPGHGGFHPGHEYHPPRGSEWGWHDHDRWQRGYDPWFYRQDPNWEQWRDPIRDAANDIAQRLDYGDAQGAANELSVDLYQMRGDRYAQDELLSQVNRRDIKGIGADLYLGAWDPARGTWDDIEILPSDGSPNIQITAYDYNDSAPWDPLRVRPRAKHR